MSRILRRHPTMARHMAVARTRQNRNRHQMRNITPPMPKQQLGENIRADQKYESRPLMTALHFAQDIKASREVLLLFKIADDDPSGT